MRPIQIPPGAPRAAPNATQAWTWLAESMWRVEHAFERSKAEGRAADDARLRIGFILVIFALAFVVLGVMAGRAALEGGAEDSIAAEAAPLATRTELVDRNNHLLAVDLTRWDVYINPQEIWDREEVRRGLIAALPDLDQTRLQKMLDGAKRDRLVRGLSREEWVRVRELGLPGVSFQEEQSRDYPQGRSTAHLIGFSDPYGKGLAGAEGALDAQVRKAAGTGQARALAVDIRVQAVLEDELRRAMAAYGARGAVGVVTDVHTGEILGLSSMPDFDPNAAGAAPDASKVNQAAASVYEMGSTFKIFTSAMGLDSGTATVNSTFDATTPLHIGSRVIHDYHGTNRVLTLEETFLHSSNIGTARLALAAGPETLTRYFGAFGLFRPAQVELAESTRPITPPSWNTSTVASASFGHALSVSPLAVAAGVGAIMNGGTYVPLTIQKRTGPVAGHRVVSEATSRTMLHLMRMNVLKGSGTHADAPGLRVGGKTGSAEKAVGGRYERQRLVSSFAAVFPTDGAVSDPRYLVLILFDEPQRNEATHGQATAGWTAAPVAGRVIDRIAPFVGVRRTMTPFAPPKTPAPVGEEPSEGEL